MQDVRSHSWIKEKGPSIKENSYILNTYFMPGAALHRETTLADTEKQAPTVPQVRTKEQQRQTVTWV